MSKVSVPITNDFCPQTMFLYGTYKENGDPDFGLFCWFSYCWDGEMGVMACIGGDKSTKDNIHRTKVFSANLVTENILALADYCGNVSGRTDEKKNAYSAVTKGQVLDVPVLEDSPVSFELEVNKAIPLDDGEVYICKVRNVLMDSRLAERAEGAHELLQSIRPVSTTCQTYFSHSGEVLGTWGSLMNKVK
jgi:flavin reductase (DIM6/NTAB) family NADH-FMN oxidoreductase RutF